ncbi:hypothetical protein V495_00275 [Pseudogymnoascus sp. VKM F-4514 (FW-929)]|nr:hypothetical protein V495_00275 [Pseudogymnoascus sp. VKM F-4514 (FW-929)]KFY67002.1 hypothetical protein V497_00602 [Pseudogymnoascus sp. VKM F-4516 (FW-969)]
MKFTSTIISISALLALPTSTLAFSCDPGEVAVGQTVFCQIGNPVSGGSCVTSAEIGTHDCGSTYAISTTADICGSDYSNDVEVTCDGDGNVTAPMQLSQFLLALPPSLILLSSHAISAHAHRNGAALPPPAHLPEPQLIQKREAIAARIGSGTKPVKVRKMSEDEGEMFFNEYWGFEARDEEGGGQQGEEDASLRLRREYQDEDTIALGNSSAILPFRPAFAIHEAESSDAPPGLENAKAQYHRSSRALAALRKRAFQCPTGTSACTSISQPNYCCASSESCVSITDTGLGPVGCCPAGQSCKGDITHCAAGQTACPQSLGGACCVPGFFSLLPQLRTPPQPRHPRLQRHQPRTPQQRQRDPRRQSAEQARAPLSLRRRLLSSQILARVRRASMPAQRTTQARAVVAWAATVRKRFARPGGR